MASSMIDRDKDWINFFNKKGGFTVYCEWEENTQFYGFSMRERASNLSYNETKADGID